MKLFYSPASPFARKVLVVAHELGLSERITVVPAAANPMEKEKAIAQLNPAGKIPTLQLDNGEALFDSRVICEYLDALAGGDRMFPAGEARWKALVLQSLADEALDSCILARYEQLYRPESMRIPDWVDAQMHKVFTTLDVLERDWIHYLAAHVNIGPIAVGALLGYLDFRFAHVGWRNGRPRLAAWADGFAGRPSMSTTAPTT